MAQITFFSQLSEVQLNNWAIQTSQFVVEHYSSDGNYSSSQRLNSDEFLSSLNDYCDRLAETPLFFNNDSNPEYLGKNPRLAKEFSSETAIWESKLDALEASTTKFKGQYLVANSMLSGEPIHYFNSELAEKIISNNCFSYRNTGKSSIHAIEVENNEHQRGFSNTENLSVEVIQDTQDTLKQPTETTFDRLFYSSDRLNIGLFWSDYCCDENSVDTLEVFQTVKVNNCQTLASNTWGLPTNRHLNNYSEWQGLSSQENLGNPERKGDVRVLNLAINVALPNSDRQSNFSRILVDIKLI